MTAPASFVMIDSGYDDKHDDDDDEWVLLYLYRQPWQGNTGILIDRYDVRTHIDYVAETPSNHRTYAALHRPILFSLQRHC